MNAKKTGSLHLCGFYGKLNSLSTDDLNTSYILDANVVLQLLQYQRGKVALSPGWKRFLHVSRQVVERGWVSDHPTVLVNPVLGIIELTKQHREQNFEKYFENFNQILCETYGLHALDPAWIIPSFNAGLKACSSTLPGLALTIEKTYSLIPDSEKLSNAEVLSSCENLLDWLWRNRAQIDIIGGPLLYLCIYAIAGSPDANNFLKVNNARKTDARAVALNVAWDLLYWLVAEMEYHRNQYNDCVVCTSDKALAQLLSSRVHQGPRIGMHSQSLPQEVEAYGDFSPIKLKRLENSKLEKSIFEMVWSFFSALSKSDYEATKVGFPKGF